MHTAGNVPQSLSDHIAFVRDNAEFIDCFARSGQEQSGAIAEVTTAIRQMDEMTQHNAAIEQTEGHANDLDRLVDVFRLTDAVKRSRGPAGVGRGAPRATPERKKVTAAALTCLSHDNAALKSGWNEF